MPDDTASVEPAEDDNAAEPAEPAEPDDAAEPAERAEPEDAGEPAEPDDAPSSTALAQNLDREATRHETALARILGVSLDDLHACPTCLGVGYTPEPIEAEGDAPQDPFLKRCKRCDGYGAVKTGARTRALDEVPCPACTGKGYEQEAEQPTAQPTFVNGPTAVAQGYPAPQVAQGDADAVADLRARGYTIVEPIVVPAPEPV